MRKVSALASSLLLVGCAVGPKYQRPTIDAPPASRGENSGQSATVAADSLGNEKWLEVFQDPVLQPPNDARRVIRHFALFSSRAA